jgi:CubicO group peptidase (beta-lactamase class C family)
MISLSFISCSQAVSKDTKHRLKQLESKLGELQQVLKIPGMSVAVLKDQQVIWSRGFGYADLENNIKASSTTPYLIASLTKPVATTLFLQLLEQKKVNLDDPLSMYHRDFQTNRVHIRHILTHTAATFAEGMKPGDKYAYNGSFFGYLASVIEKGCGQPFRDQLVKGILQRLQMNNSVPGQNILSTANLSPAIYTAEILGQYKMVLDSLAKPYTLYGASENVLSPYPPQFIGSSAGLISTVTDLAKFDIAIDEHRLLLAATQDLAWTNSLTNSGEQIPYGLGWFVQQVGSRKIIWHYGQWPTFSGLYLKVPEKNITMILLANSTALSAPFDMGAGDVLNSPFAIAFLKNFNLEKTVLTEREKMTDSSVQRYLKSRRDRVRKVKIINNDSLTSYTGQYALDSTHTVTIGKKADLLTIEYSGQPVIDLFPESDIQFFVKIADTQVVFIKGENGKVPGLTLITNGKQQKATKK